MPRYIVEAAIVTPHRFAITAENVSLAKWKVEDRLSEQLARGDYIQTLDVWEAEPFDNKDFYDEDLD